MCLAEPFHGSHLISSLFLVLISAVRSAFWPISIARLSVVDAPIYKGRIPLCNRRANGVVAYVIVAWVHRFHLLRSPSPTPTLFRLQMMILSASDPRAASLVSYPSHMPSLASARGHGKLLTCTGY